MSFAKTQPQPAGPSLNTVSADNWSILEAMGGALVRPLRREIEEQYRLAEEARAREDRRAAFRHTEQAEALFVKLEDYLAYLESGR